MRATQEPASIIHFGTHVVPDPASPGSVAIALGLNSNGSADYLTAPDIAGWRCPAGIIVLSGCASGTGKALPGAGLLGLTRAWLVAGAQAVAATYWPIPDDAQSFFSAFYTHLQRHATTEISSSAAAASLRAAQIEAMRSGGAYAKPEYWAAFFVVGKD
jgi:CHAT domain-containing protein